LATIEVIENENLLKDVDRKAKLFKSLFTHPAIKEIRNVGLMMAVEFESFDILKAIIDQSVENGVLTDWFLFNDKSMRIAPPLTITETEIKDACEQINKAIELIIE
jgi:acetylornithine/succinyldiaminopimelate/putrescine aminotransferase